LAKAGLTEKLGGICLLLYPYTLCNEDLFDATLFVTVDVKVL
jgi:hypothetical protein